MPRKKGYKMVRSPQKVVRSVADAKGTDPVRCICAESPPRPMLLGSKYLRLVGKGDADVKLSTVVALMRHEFTSFCTWNTSVLDSICNQAKTLKLQTTVEGQYNVFDTRCSLSVGTEIKGQCVHSEFYDALQTVLLEHSSCLLDLGGFYCAVVHHNKYFVVLDFNGCDAYGMPFDFGKSIALVHTSFMEVIMHIVNLSEKLNAGVFSAVSVKVDVADSGSVLSGVSRGVDLKSCSVSLQRLKLDKKVTPVDGNVVPTAAGIERVDEFHCVQGSFHQGDVRFGDNRGRQCVAVSLAAMVMHEVKSVMTWGSQELDDVVVSGDNFYTFLKTHNMISDQSNARYLLINDLPEQGKFKDCQYRFEYSQPVVGDLHVEEGDFISQGLAYRLRDGMEKIFASYDRCFFTFDGRTCAIFCQGGHYFVCDSHARDTKGMISASGKSVVLHYPTLAGVCDVIHSWHSCREIIGDGNPFEITGVTVYPICADVNVVDVCPEIMEELSEGSIDVVDVNGSGFGSPLKGFNFNVLSKDIAQNVCSRLNIEFERHSDMRSGSFGALGEPCTTDHIVGDGNCFFRAVSQVVCGNQRFHRTFRLAIVKHMESNESLFATLIRREYSSLMDYLVKSRMKFVGSWATEVEIQSAANLLGLDVYTYSSSRWLKYGCMGRRVSEQGIYLMHLNGNHYEAVVCVKHVDLIGCYGLCKAQKLVNEQKIQTRSVESNRVDLREDAVMQSKRKHVEGSDSKYIDAKRKLTLRLKYKHDGSCQEKKKTAVVQKYINDEQHRLTLRNSSKRKYCEDKDHRFSVQNASKRKYSENEGHRLAVRKAVVQKYAMDQKYRMAVREASVKKYAVDEKHRLSVREASVKKYAVDQKHRLSVREASVKKYKVDEKHRLSLKMANKRRSVEMKDNRQHFDFVLRQFQKKVKNGPDFVCCVCHRLLFRPQVLSCNKDYYLQKKDSSLAARKCITEQFLHKCDNCELPCKWLQSPRGKLWICYCCDAKLRRGEMPAESIVNNLHLSPIPPELSCLNSLERHLVSLHIPFMKLLALPKGGQNGVHGPVTCVPSNIVETTQVLPRIDSDGSLLRVKLKRKLTYKGHYEYKFVDTDNIKRALQCLKSNNPYYRDIEFNDDWLNQFEKDSEDVVIVDEEADAEAEAEQEKLHDRQSHGMFMDTCLQPLDLGQEVLDQFDNILNVAPAEGNNPVQVLRDQTNEAKSFPTLFPTGSPTYHDFRNNRLTLSRYFNNRILNADGRFGENLEYIFYAQYMSEVEQVSSNISIALRKGYKCNNRGKISADMLNDDECLKTLFQANEGYRFLKPIRGTPAFWSGVQKDLFAMVRQLGLPTFFCSFSSADLRWGNLLSSMLHRDGRSESVESLDWAEKCDLLRRNPVTAARMFDFRWRSFLRDVILSDSQPIGKVVDYFYRVEFQQRGSPHVHAIFWIEDSPQLDRESDEEVVEFIDKYISCEVPDDDEDLLETVSTVQTHSKRHAKTCKKKNTACRFNFPRPPSERTFISRVKDEDDLDQDSDGSEDPHKMTVKRATAIMSRVKTALTDEKLRFDTASQLFDSVGIDQHKFELAYECIGKKTEVVLKRKASDVWINPFNKELLKGWNANMDIQYVLDAYACIVYIITYISKAERQMGLMLSNAQHEAVKENNTDAKKTLRRIGSVYLHNREVGAQEAVYRLTNMHLKESSRKTEFIATGDGCISLSLPLKVLQQKANRQQLSDKDMWMTSHVDRYKARPDETIFNEMCLATFVSEYRVLPKTEKSKNKVKLDKDLGFVLKRTRTKAAIVRYARFSGDKNPEKYFQSGLQLFLPYRFDADLKPTGFSSFEQFYRDGQCTINGVVHSVQSVVDVNRQKFEQEGEDIVNAEHVFNSTGLLEDAWCEMCPEQQLERLECQQEVRERQQMDDEHVDVIPDLAAGSEGNRIEASLNSMCRSDALDLLRSLNDNQRAVFYQVRQWCLETVNGKNPQPFHVFITGGAGTGKSHLIKAIQYEATRLLSRVASAPDKVSVLLTAPTGIAAFNLGAGTIHHTFSIGINVKLPYTPLGEEKVNTLRASFSDLKILVIDEISMVDHNLLAFVHGRLRQIKQTGDHSPFGRVSVIAVGDFFQLSPVKGKPLYLENTPVDLWTGNFSVAELTVVVRQQDTTFAEVLNRLRTRGKSTPLSASDVDILKNCETGESSSALHIFPTNDQVDEHNQMQLSACCPDFVSLGAQDYAKNKQTGQLELKKGHFAKVYSSSLPQTLLLGKGARVMLVKNIDVPDGLVNGVCGVVTDMLQNANNTFVTAVFVQFDDEKVGRMRRRRIPVSVEPRSSTPIYMEQERVNSKGGLRRQFPLKLAWACTVHKVQGLTVEKAVVSLKRIFAPGQAYVGLSRVKALTGLIVQDFAEKAIYCRDNIQESVQNMPQFVPRVNALSVNNQAFTVFSLNVQSLRGHLSDLTVTIQPFPYDCIAVTETWLPANAATDTTCIANYNFHSSPRCSAYSMDNTALQSIKDQQHGGVGIYCKAHSEYNILDIPNVDLECICCHFSDNDIIVVVIYRPPTYPLSVFINNIKQLSNMLSTRSDNIVILGDFNHDELKSTSMSTFMSSLGYMQSVSEPTTEKGTLIDHVYIKTTNFLTDTKVLPLYFSTHEAISCTLTKQVL